MPKLLHSERGVWNGYEGFYLSVSDGGATSPRMCFVKDEELILGWLSFDTQSLATRADDAESLKREGARVTQREREAAMVRCSAESQRCDVRSFTLVNKYPHQPEALKAAGFVLMSEHAAYVKPCEEHAAT